MRLISQELVRGIQRFTIQCRRFKMSENLCETAPIKVPSQTNRFDSSQRGRSSKNKYDREQASYQNQSRCMINEIIESENALSLYSFYRAQQALLTSSDGFECSQQLNFIVNSAQYFTICDTVYERPSVCTTCCRWVGYICMPHICYKVCLRVVCEEEGILIENGTKYCNNKNQCSRSPSPCLRVCLPFFFSCVCYFNSQSECDILAITSPATTITTLVDVEKKQRVAATTTMTTTTAATTAAMASGTTIATIMCIYMN